MAVDLNGMVHLILMGLTDHVFGNIILTSVMVMVFILIFALLIQIPLPFAFALPIPLAVVFTAFGYLPILVGGLLSAGFLILAVASFLSGVGAK